MTGVFWVEFLFWILPGRFLKSERENYRIHQCHIRYFPQDGTIRVHEPKTFDPGDSGQLINRLVYHLFTFCTVWVPTVEISKHAENMFFPVCQDRGKHGDSVYVNPNNKNNFRTNNQNFVIFYIF
jgi:hypothetical protein